MKRLRPLDRAMVLILVPIWVACFTLGVNSQLRGAGIMQIGVSIPAESSGYPVLNGEFSPIYPSDPLEDAGLREGDVLVRLADVDLHGVGPLRLAGLASEYASPGRRVRVVFERAGRRGDASLELFPLSALRVTLAISLTLAASVLFLFLRAAATRFTRALFYAGMCNAILYPVYAATSAEFYAWATIAGIGITLAFPLLIRAVQVFPHEIPPKTRWDRSWPWCFVVVGAFYLVFLLGHPRIGTFGMMATSALALTTILALATGNYRSCDPIGRRQMKWIVFGAYCAVLPVILAVSLSLARPELVWVAPLSWWGYPVAFIFLPVALVRFNFVDVDRVLSATASYNILLVLLGTGALVAVPRVAESASALAGIDPGKGQVALSLLLASVVVPAHRRLRPQIDRVFFKERYALDQGIAELLPTLSRCSDTRELTERAGHGLNRLLRPEGCVVYARVGESYAPVFVEGRAVPPAFGASSPLVGTLGERRKPLALGDAGRRPDEASLGPFDRAALETLGAEVVVPVRQDDALAAFVCLGPKRSGDVYTSTDLSLLAAVAEKVSSELRLFDQEAVTREAQAMQESLRRYVPGAVAEQLSSGAELASAEREVTVLFVDIRGYTSFSESRRAADIFSTVNRYTEAVSQIVQKHAGSVVEFNGDGMMTVFGAPRELAHKERAAVEAGREIVEAVGAMPIDDAKGGQTKLSVGVGVATGEAFVGNIQAVDRMIWSAIGNTTNLAARLQALSRELDAAMVIDQATFRGAADAAADFGLRAQVPIRGRSQREDLYLLPVSPSGA